MSGLGLGHSVLMLGGDVVVLRQDDLVQLPKASKPVPPDEFATRMNASVHCQAQIKRDRIIPLLYASSRPSPVIQSTHLNPFDVVDLDYSLLENQQSTPYWAHPTSINQDQEFIGSVDSHSDETKIDPIGAANGFVQIPARFSKDEIDLLFETAQKTSMNWQKVANVMNAIFQPQQQAKYTAQVVQKEFHRVFGDVTLGVSHDLLRSRSDSFSVTVESDSEHSQSESENSVTKEDGLSFIAAPCYSHSREWFQDETDYLREMAISVNYDWIAVASLMSKKFGSERRPQYSAKTVMGKYAKLFPGHKNRRRIQWANSKEAIDFLRTAAEDANFDWDKVTELVNERFDKKRTVSSVVTAYRRYCGNPSSRKSLTLQPSIDVKAEPDYSSMDSNEISDDTLDQKPTFQSTCAKFPWSKVSIDFLHSAAANVNYDWVKVTDLVNERFRTSRSIAAIRKAYWRYCSKRIACEPPSLQPVKDIGKHHNTLNHSERCRFPWPNEAVEFLCVAVQATDHDWTKVAELVNERFGTNRSPGAVKRAYERHCGQRPLLKEQASQQKYNMDWDHIPLGSDCSTFENSEIAPKSSVWTQEETNFLTLSAPKVNWNWHKAAKAMEKKFGSKFRSYTTNSVYQKYVRMFPDFSAARASSNQSALIRSPSNCDPERDDVEQLPKALPSFKTME